MLDLPRLPNLQRLMVNGDCVHVEDVGDGRDVHARFRRPSEVHFQHSRSLGRVWISSTRHTTEVFEAVTPPGALTGLDIPNDRQAQRLSLDADDTQFDWPNYLVARR